MARGIASGVPRLWHHRDVPRRLLSLTSWLLIALAVACGRGRPRIDAPEATVDISTFTPGLAPDQAHDLIAAPLEAAISTVDGIEHIASRSEASATTTTVWIAPGADRFVVRRRLLAAIEGVLAQLPRGSAMPGLTAGHERSETPRAVVRSTHLAAVELRGWVETALRYKLLQQPGVRDVAVCGGATAVVRVAIDPDHLAGHGLFLDDVATAMARPPAPGGQRGGSDRDFTLRGLTTTLDTLRATVVSVVNGAPVRLDDLATIEDGSDPDPCPAPAPAGAVVADVSLGGDADAQAVAHAIRALAGQAPQGVTVQIVHAPVRFAIALSGSVDRHDLAALAAAWRGALAGPGVVVETDAPAVVALEIDRAAAARAGASTLDIQSAIAAAGLGDEVAEIEDAGARRPVRLVVRGGDVMQLRVRGRVPVGLDTLVRRSATPGRVESFDRQPATIVRFAVDDSGDRAADSIAAGALARAQKAAPPPAGVRITAWREP
jgi:multidrug efflux pump subunit AcrB